MAVLYQYWSKLLIRLFLVWTLVASAGNSRAETLDRVVASVGTAAITASDVEREYRFERFLDAQWPPPPPDAGVRDRVRERLIYQLLLKREEAPAPEESSECEKAAAERLAVLHQKFARAVEFQAALDNLGMTEAEAVARVAQQELLLRMIDQRLRPAATSTDEDVADYYRNTFTPEFQKKNAGAAPPPLTSVADQIRQLLTEKHVNELLDQWIEEMRPTSRVKMHSF